MGSASSANDGPSVLMWAQARIQTAKDQASALRVALPDPSISGAAKARVLVDACAMSDASAAVRGPGSQTNGYSSNARRRRTRTPGCSAP